MKNQISIPLSIVLILLLTNTFNLRAQGKKAQTTNNQIRSKTIVFVTGAFVSNSCWDEWRKYFEAKGYKTLAPSWPNKEGTAASLRAMQPRDTALANTTLKEVIDHYTRIIKQLPEKPIIIGHSFGGMITQVLVNRDLAAAGIAIHPAPPKGVLPYERSFIRGGIGSLGIFTSKSKTYLMSFKRWQYAFANGLPLAEQRASYDQLIIPESKTVSKGALTKDAQIDFALMHAPLLITSGNYDHIIPAHLNYRNFKKYKQNGSITEYKEFKGRNHMVLGISTWREDADYIDEWINKYSN
jgi:pimeloyl-ACP methyl ester carboxylesterase